MPARIEIVTQPMLVPHGGINGEKHYRDYGWQFVWIMNMDNDPPTVFASGVTPSQGVDTQYYGMLDDPAVKSKSLLPIVKDVDGVGTEEAFGTLRK